MRCDPSKGSRWKIHSNFKKGKIGCLMFFQQQRVTRPYFFWKKGTKLFFIFLLYLFIVLLSCFFTWMWFGKKGSRIYFSFQRLAFTRLHGAGERLCQIKTFCERYVVFGAKGGLKPGRQHLTWPWEDWSSNKPCGVISIACLQNVMESRWRPSVRSPCKTTHPGRSGSPCPPPPH